MATGDEFKTVQPGDRFRMPARVYNGLVRLLQDRGVDIESGELPGSLRGQTIVKVRNDGSDRNSYEVLKLNDVAVDEEENLEEFQRRTGFVGVVPTATTDNVCILMEPAASGQYARAVLWGLATVQVNVTSASHNFANPTASDATKLTSGSTGLHRILYKPSGTGTKWCLVLVGDSGSGGTSTIIHGTCHGRLAIGPSQGEEYNHGSTGSFNLHFHPCNGDQVGVWNGSSWEIRELSSPTPISISNSGLSANTNYDVFVFWNTTVLALELVAWSNDTTRATNLAYRDGILVKTSDHTRRYVGTVRTNGSAFFQDTHDKRFVWNAYNRALKYMVRTEPASSWAASTDISGAWRNANNSSSNRVEFVLGYPGGGHKIPEMIRAHVRAWVIFAGASPEANATVGIGFDSSGPWGGLAASNGINYEVHGATAHDDQKTLVTADAAGYPTAPGYHYFQWIEKVVAGGAGITWHALDGTGQYHQAGIFGEIWC